MKRIFDLLRKLLPFTVAAATCQMSTINLEDFPTSFSISNFKVTKKRMPMESFAFCEALTLFPSQVSSHPTNVPSLGRIAITFSSHQLLYMYVCVFARCAHGIYHQNSGTIYQINTNKCIFIPKHVIQGAKEDVCHKINSPLMHPYHARICMYVRVTYNV